MKLALLRCLFLAPLASLSLACGAAPPTEPPTSGDPSTDVTVSVDEHGSEAQLFNTSGSGTGGSATCYSLTCPDGKLEGCFTPCVSAGGSVSRCSTACGCTATPRECTPKKAYAY